METFIGAGTNDVDGETTIINVLLVVALLIAGRPTHQLLHIGRPSEGANNNDFVAQIDARLTTSTECVQE